MKYVTTDQHHKIIGFYDNVISQAPEGAWDISDETWQNALEIGANHFEFGEFSIVIEPPTQAQLIAVIRARYDKAIQDVCTANLLNDINSARNLATLANSPLKIIAQEITDWELEQQIIFIKLLEDAQQDIIELNASTFNDNFTQFEQ